jgi:hypothetical protein
MCIDTPGYDMLQMPEQWINAQSLNWLQQSLESYITMAEHISTAVYTGQLRKIRVDTDAMVCSLPDIIINDSNMSLRLNFETDRKGGWNLTGVTLNDEKALTILAAPIRS